MSSTRTINCILGWARQREHEARYQLQPGPVAEIAITTRTRTIGVKVSGDTAWLASDPREECRPTDDIEAWLDERIGR